MTFKCLGIFSDDAANPLQIRALSPVRQLARYHRNHDFNPRHPGSITIVLTTNESYLNREIATGIEEDQAQIGPRLYVKHDDRGPIWPRAKPGVNYILPPKTHC